MKSIRHYSRKIAEHGFIDLILRRLSWYKLRLQMDNWYIGRLVELFGNRVRLQGISLTVDNPLVTTRHKGSIYFGIYEIEERKLSSKYIDRSIPTVELGGSIGGVACVVNRLLDNPDRHVVLECNPILLPTLEKNRDINCCKFSIEPFAIGYGAPTISFSISDHFMLGGTKVTDGKHITVNTSSLRVILDRHDFKTINLISDCEGAEVDLVENEPELLRECVKWLIVETHEMNVGADRLSKMMSDLERLGFEKVEQSRQTVLALKNRHLV